MRRLRCYRMSRVRGPDEYSSRNLLYTLCALTASTSPTTPGTSWLAGRLHRLFAEPPQKALVLDGKRLAAEIRDGLKTRIRTLKKTHRRGRVRPHDDSRRGRSGLDYLCEDEGQRLPRRRHALVQGAASRSDDHRGTFSQIDALYADPDVQGILLQSPVPPLINEQRCFDRIVLAKDVDGVSAHSFGRMALGHPVHAAATPAGLMRLLTHYQIDLRGKETIVVGRSRSSASPWP